MVKIFKSRAEKQINSPVFYISQIKGHCGDRVLFLQIGRLLELQLNFALLVSASPLVFIELLEGHSCLQPSWVGPHELLGFFFPPL